MDKEKKAKLIQGATLLTGKVEAIGPVTLVGEKQTKLQYMILFIPAWTDRFGDTKGRHQYWCLQAMGKKVDELKMTDDLVNQKVEVMCWLDSQCIESKEAGRDPFYAVNATIHEFDILP